MEFILDFLGYDRKVKHCVVTYPFFYIVCFLRDFWGGDVDGTFDILAAPFAEYVVHKGRYCIAIGIRTGDLSNRECSVRLVK